MKPIHLEFISPKGIEASLYVDGKKGKHDYRAVVTIQDLIEDKEIYGTDPVHALLMGLQLIETLTNDARIGTDGEVPMPGELWTIKTVTKTP